MDFDIPWWRTSFGEEEIARIAVSIRAENVSQGSVTAQFERELAELLEVEDVIAVSSGTSALVMALMAVGVSSGDEVIVPNRTWIATANAVHMLGAKVVLVDVEEGLPILDVNDIESAITAKTKAIIPVHMNGRATNMRVIRQIARRHGLFIVEDAAQAIGSRNASGYLGTQSDIGCFSLSVAKTISTGQGGFAVTSEKSLARQMRAIRTQGVENVKSPKEWTIPGLNFRFTDIQASIGLEQLRRLPARIQHLKELYGIYGEGLKGSPFQQIPVEIQAGEVPLYSECLVRDREKWIRSLQTYGIETRPFYPGIDRAKYLGQGRHNFPNSRKFEVMGIYLPSGPGQSFENVRSCIEKIIE